MPPEKSLFTIVRQRKIFFKESELGKEVKICCMAFLRVDKVRGRLCRCLRKTKSMLYTYLRKREKSVKARSYFMLQGSTTRLCTYFRKR